MGLKATVAPLFTVAPIAWQPPDPIDVDCIILTSANAVRHGGNSLALFAGLPCFTVGKATAAAAAAAGFLDVRPGPRDGAALAEMAARDGMKRPLHLCGREHIALEHDLLSIRRRIVYAAEAADALPAAAADALRSGCLALLHSARAGALFARLVGATSLDRSGVTVAAISEAAARAAGPGWGRIVVAPEPRDEPLLELAAKLCQTVPIEAGNGE